jgi:hypothetical protein
MGRCIRKRSTVSLKEEAPHINSPVFFWIFYLLRLARHILLGTESSLKVHRIVLIFDAFDGRKMKDARCYRPV